MVDDRGHVIEQGRCIPPPPRIEVGEWTLVTVRFHEALKKFERRSENSGGGTNGRASGRGRKPGPEPRSVSCSLIELSPRYSSGGSIGPVLESGEHRG
jgi:hypothetical protein